MGLLDNSSVTGAPSEKAGAEMVNEFFVLVSAAESAGEIFHMSFLCV